MTFSQELASWNPFNTTGGPKVSKPPAKGDKAPSVGELTFPLPDNKPAVIAFLRHCGCPFAEKTFLNLRALAATNEAVQFIAVSHSDKASTDKWLTDIGGQGNVRVIVDYERNIYAAWGLGASSLWHVLQPRSLMGVGQVQKEDGIKVRPTSSGSRWQTAGNYAVDREGNVAWGRPSKSAEDMPSVEDGLSAVKN